MLTAEFTHELHSSWLPHITECGLDRLIELLEKNSPLLIQGSFTRVVPMGCLATHIAWNHPHTRALTLEAGVCWLNRVAGLNPATSHVIRDWDRRGNEFEFRQELLRVLKEERQLRRDRTVVGQNRIKNLIDAVSV
jgi:hypothetical protein